MYKFGVIDLVEVVRTALQDAASVAGLLITTEAMIADKPEPKGQRPAAACPAGTGRGAGRGGTTRIRAPRGSLIKDRGVPRPPFFV